MNTLGLSLVRNLRASFHAGSCLTQTRSLGRSIAAYGVRWASTHVQSDVQLPAQETPKPKPKTSTQLKRSAAASLPIRANPTPTRSPIQPVSILTTAERYLLPGLQGRLPSQSMRLHKAWWVPKWTVKDQNAEVFIFENGSIVCWGLDEADARRFAKKYTERSEVAVGPIPEPETEDVEFVTDPNESTRLQGDLIILGHTPPPEDEATLPQDLPDMVYPKETLLARYSFSQALARSTALSALESSLDTYLSSVSVLPHTLSTTGKPSLGRQELIMKLGELMRFRQWLNLSRENFLDTPDFYWAEPILEGYFNSMTAALDMKARTRSVNDKITYAAEFQSMMRELLTESSAHRMELIIILLIAVEVFIALIRDGPDLWHLLTDSDDRSKANKHRA